MSRFVILHHEMPDSSEKPTHFDVMLEYQGELVTFSIEGWPENAAPVVAQRLSAHRIEYLDYQGPVSGNRGTVSQFDRGTYEPVGDVTGDFDEWQLILSGSANRGRLHIYTKNGESWLQFESECRPMGG